MNAQDSEMGSHQILRLTSVSIGVRGSARFKVTNCNLKAWPRPASKVFSPIVYRAWNDKWQQRFSIAPARSRSALLSYALLCNCVNSSAKPKQQLLSIAAMLIEA